MDVKLPDGTIIKNVPEGTTQSQLMAKVGKLDLQGMQGAALNREYYLSGWQGIRGRHIRKE